MADSVNIRILDGDVGDRLMDSGPTDFVVPEAYTIKSVVAKTGQLAMGRPINRLTLICHGGAEMVYGDVAVDWKTLAPKETVLLPGRIRSDASASVCKVYGGYGIFLGKEALSLDNVSSFRDLRSKFSCSGLIEICACAAADTGPTVGGLSGDGPTLMKALAAATGASVRAAVQIQRALRIQFRPGYPAYADRTAFTGPTYLFKPNGQQIADTACY